MNIKEYISSGILEAYVLGDVTSSERVEIEQNLSKYPELKEELDRVERTVEEFTMTAAVQPSDVVRRKVLAVVGEIKDSKVVEMKPSAWRYATAASVAIAALTSYMAYHYYNRWETTSQALDTLIAQNQQIAQDYNVVNEKLDKIQDDFSIIESAAFTRVVMKGTAIAPDAMASVYWNSGTQEVYLSIQNLKDLSQANQFQLWAIVDGKPVDAGVFDVGVEGLLQMKPIGKAVAFAVTIEPRGGKSSPTMETMQVMGGIPNS
ncbi:MAG: anti-sigma factor [Cyclobacteriaceae bacterium]